jgi:hypothetical protein
MRKQDREETRHQVPIINIEIAISQSKILLFFEDEQHNTTYSNGSNYELSNRIMQEGDRKPEEYEAKSLRMASPLVNAFEKVCLRLRLQEFITTIRKRKLPKQIGE